MCGLNFNIWRAGGIVSKIMTILLCYTASLSDIHLANVLSFGYCSSTGDEKKEDVFEIDEIGLDKEVS